MHAHFFNIGFQFCGGMDTSSVQAIFYAQRSFITEVEQKFFQGFEHLKESLLGRIKVLCSKFVFEILIFSKTLKTALLICHQPNITQRPFCIQNERQDILYYLIYRPLLQLFYKLSNKATKKQYFERFEKTPNFGRMVRTLKNMIF